ncbi:uncharacterized protein PV06_01925 [Exophiala oligosperma]|uniref:Major facilitator superfamily (MFS) profile domain-containing protein n=3 Tax=Chaetothyriales TaxID=34395 RepID=A0A0D2C8T0_9EURO|nr:uncharacterized protein PV06_01925 [Exophiala oligosperma]KAJ9646095.1 hypothetical protein H2204_000757 [Knufia peltigerae]KIW46242.1 hypothetical protein PV06_01925 [Exophiala oligosperma]
MTTKEQLQPAATEVPEPHVSERDADVTFGLLKQYGGGEVTQGLDRAGERRLNRKLYFILVPLLVLINLLLFIDKATLAYSSILGLFGETGIDGGKYNNLNTLFYAGYIIGQVPGHYLMQRIPLSRFMAGATFLWTLIVFLHCTASSYGDLIALRFFLGMVEAPVVPAIEITLGMFFVPATQGLLQPLFWISCMGAPVPAGFIAYGLLYIHSTILPWKFFMIITGSMTFLLTILVAFLYPNNPAEAHFLTVPERIHLVHRIHAATTSSIEHKQLKRYQLLEAVRDPVSWLFGLQAFTLMISNNIAYQQNLLFVSLGVSNLGSTLVSAASGGFSVACCIAATLFLRYIPLNKAFWSTFWCLPAIAGGIGMCALQWDSKLSLLACLILAGSTFGITYIIALGWTTSTSAGYTKKLARNVFFMAGYGIANLISPQIWASRDAPRYYPAWVVQIVISWTGTPLILIIIHFILKRRNAERYEWIAEQERLGKTRTGVIDRVTEDGAKVQVEVDVSLLDLTDGENKYFIYPL